MSLLTGKWNVYKCDCGCEFAIKDSTQKDKGYEVCPDCDEKNVKLLGSQTI